MSSLVSSFLKKRLFAGRRNLVSFDEPYRVMARLLSERRVNGIIDAGASNGHISERLLRRFPDAAVYGFEPNPLYAEVLREYARREPRFHPQFMALSDHVGQSPLHIMESPGTTSLLTAAERLKEVAPTGAALKTIHEVDVITIDEWARRAGHPSIELMKFDIQGAELQALRGAANVLDTSVLLVYTEIWFNPVYEGGALYTEIDAFLRSHGFILYDLFKPKYDHHRLLIWGNAIFVHAERLNL